MSERAFITGITGQDGSYLAEYLLSRGYEVHGLIRKASTFNTARIDHLYQDPHESGARLFLHYGDLTDSTSLASLLRNLEPTQVYNLASQSHVRVSFEMPVYTGIVTGVGTTSILEALRRADSDARFYNASSSEIFGQSHPPQNEETPFRPRSPYAAAKVYSYWMTVSYREAYGMRASNGILFNHESPRRGETFVTRKITRALAKIMAGTQSKIFLGNLRARRDWGYAPEYVVGMVRIQEHREPVDLVLGTGTSHSVEEFLGFAFDYLGLDWKKHVEIDKRYMRPAEVDHLTADAQKAHGVINWNPIIKAPELAKVMVDHDMSAIGLDPPGEGLSLLKSNGFDWFEEPSLSLSGREAR